MKTNKILVIIIIVLTTLNVVTLVIIWRGHRITDSDHRHKQMGERFLKRKLDLTKKQVGLFETARKEHQTAIKKLMLQGAGIRKKLTLNLSQSNKQLEDSLVNKLSENQMQIEYLNLDHLKKLRSFCTPEQASRFDSVFSQVMERPRMRRARGR